jgi:hypothetical protein
MGAKGARDRERSFFSNPTPAAGPSLPQLLSLPSSDLDVTLSSVSGFEFATAFHAYLSQLDPPIPTRSIGKVAANPDQSKHLETAATKILGLDLDFVALRSESYADGSRIPSEVVSLEGGGGCIGRPRTRAAQLSRGVSFSPKQRLGTAEEDALRRDITINTLFYNVHSRQVEDWTGKVRSRRTQTPKPPTPDQTVYPLPNPLRSETQLLTPKPNPPGFLVPPHTGPPRYGCQAHTDTVRPASDVSRRSVARTPMCSFREQVRIRARPGARGCVEG